MRKALYLGLGWLVLAAGMAKGQDAPPAESHPKSETAHGHGAEVTAEDVPDHEEHRFRRFWFRPEYAVWLMRKATIPALASTSLNTSPTPGVLGTPSARVIFGNDIDLHERHGARFAFGYAFDEEYHTTLEASYEFAGTRDGGFSVFSPGSTPEFPVLARPFFDDLNKKQDASLVAYPGAVGGSFDIRLSTYFDGGEINLNRIVWQRGESRLSAIGGFRVLRLEESLHFTENVVVNPAAMSTLAGKSVLIQDLFDCENTFYGGQIGLRGQWRGKRLILEASGKLAFGATHRDVNIRGKTVVSGSPEINAGFLALASNSGAFSGTDFNFVPEGGLKLGWGLTDNFQVFMGYSFVLWDRVYRPGDQIDTNLNPNLIPTSATFGAAGGPASPAPRNNPTDFWVHSISFGFEWKF